MSTRKNLEVMGSVKWSLQQCDTVTKHRGYMVLPMTDVPQNTRTFCSPHKKSRYQASLTEAVAPAH